MTGKIARVQGKTVCGRRSLPCDGKGDSGLTLIELLIVITTISILAAMLLPSLARGKAQAKRIRCVNNLQQMGVALQMYLDDNHVYPRAMFDLTPTSDIDTSSIPVLHYLPVVPVVQYWYDSLAQYHRLQWTNRAFQCPVYEGDIETGTGSYSYNVFGTGSDGALGLGGVSEPRVIVPSDMFAIADSRIISVSFTSGTSSPLGLATFHPTGSIFMQLNFDNSAEEPQALRHGKGFNFLFCDGHVHSVNRVYFMNRTNSWPNWNNDHQAHMESWN